MKESDRATDYEKALELIKSCSTDDRLWSFVTGFYAEDLVARQQTDLAQQYSILMPSTMQIENLIPGVNGISRNI